MLNKYSFFDLQRFSDAEVEGAANLTGEATQQEPAAAAAATPDRDAEFEALIGGDYKDAYKKRTEKIVGSRVRKLNAELEQLRGENARYKKYSALVRERYPDAVDDDAAFKAFDDDPRLLNEEADRNGYPPELWREKRAIARERRAIDEEKRARDDKESRAKKMDDWIAQSEKLKETYPEFDLRAELSDPETQAEFFELIDRGYPVKKAYETVHFDALMEKARKNAAIDAEKETVEKIKSGTQRPRENGSAATPPGKLVVDLANADDETLAKIDRALRRHGHFDPNNPPADFDL